MLGTMSAQTIRFPITPTASLVVDDLYFPLASAPAAFWAAVRSDGGDIRVYKQDGVTPCAREVVGFDPATKTGSVWFAANSGTAFYICAGTGEPEPAADSTYGSQAVWGVNVKGAYHCADASGQITDSTSNANHLTKTGGVITYHQPGKSGLCVYGDGVAAAASSGDVVTGDSYSMTCWIKKYNESFLRYYISRGDANGYDTCGVNTTPKATIYIPGIANPQGTLTFPNDTWMHSAFVRDGTSVKLYINGSIDIDIAAGHSYTTGKILMMGRPDLAGREWKGYIDELRVLNRAMSAPEVAQRYAIQNDPAAFWTIGAAG